MELLTRALIAAMPPTLTGGAWGTELHRRGATMGECLPEWNLTREDDIFELAREYVELGSGMILTNTFLADAISLARTGHTEQAREMNLRGAAIAKQAAGADAYVIGVIGPVAAANASQYPGDDEGHILAAAEASAEQAATLDRAGVDAILLETQLDLTSTYLAAEAVIRAVGVPVGVTFSFHAGPAADRIPSGHGVAEICNAFADLDLAWIGANCGAGIRAVLPIAAEFARVSTFPVWIKPNAMAAPTNPQDGESDGLDAESFARFAEQIVRGGARFIGGCCGAGPEHVSALAAMLQRLQV